MPPAPPAQATPAAATTGGSNQEWDSDPGRGLLILSEDDKAQIEVELGQIRVLINRYSESHDQRPDWRTTVEEVACEVEDRLAQLKERAASAAEQLLVVQIIAMIAEVTAIRNRWIE